eukprot:COSAG01_NODE_10382_length_2180_cov_51.116771_1_plen_83_part_00
MNILAMSGCDTSILVSQPGGRIVAKGGEQCGKCGAAVCASGQMSHACRSDILTVDRMLGDQFLALLLGSPCILLLLLPLYYY